VLVASVLGTVAASTAFRSPPTGADRPAGVAAAELASARRDDAAVAALRERERLAIANAPMGGLRVQEAAVAEWEYRSRLGAQQASRSTNTPGSLIRPASGARTGWWGEGRPGHRHTGIDFDGDTGDPVVAAGAGTVVHAGGAPAGYSGYGNVVLIDHGNGVTTLYAHLSRIGVRTGTRVSPGDYLGAIGTSGNVTGSHLHFEVRIGDRPVNPGPWIAGG
jgi:murein DD-endopeptidase MepM/ murein hydrolase activator NlpD